MEKKHFKPNHMRTAQRQKFRDLCAVLLFLLLLPYACSLLFAREARETVVLDNHVSTVYVACENAAGISRVPLEEFVKGALAASVPADTQSETMKAQAVLLRTMCMRAYENRESIEENVMKEAEIGQEYLDAGQLRDLWGGSFDENYSKIRQAVQQTQGMYLTAEGKVIEPAYFELSAGMTRNGKEVFGSDSYEYFRSADCSHDIESDDYLQTRTVSASDFWKTIGSAGEETLSLTRDSAGYVLWVDAGEIHMSGERFRYLFHLPSSCFTVSEYNGQVELETKGIGHGLGMCLYEADRMASGGQDYIAILNYFFAGIQIQKTE